MRFWRRLKMAGRKPFLDSNEEIADDYVNKEKTKVLRNGLAALLVVVLLLTGLGFYWSSEPELFDVREQTAKILGERKPVVGATTTATLIHTIDVLLDKPGGYLSNDLMPPGVLLDNIPSWEFGVLVQVRDLSKAKREAFSRSQSQSTEDPDLAIAEPRFHIDHTSWAVPWPESEYAEGQEYLAKYLQRLHDDQAYDGQFFARADNLRYWLGTVETRLGSLSQRLSASVGQRRINTDLSGDAAGRQSTQAAAEVMVKTNWLQIDNVFYEARGTTWALLHFLKAIEVDFAEVLARKNAVASVQQIIRELEMSQQPVHAPVIVNGEGFGLLANHSLVMASYISRANAAIIDLRELLSQG
mgnify:CR=1 FL=1